MSRFFLSFLYIGVFLTVPEDDPRTDLPEYHDIAPVVGMVRPNSFGSPAKKLITETTGSGAAFSTTTATGAWIFTSSTGRRSSKRTPESLGSPISSFEIWVRIASKT